MRYGVRLEHLERTNDLVEAGVKGVAYLLAMSWDRAVVSLIFTLGWGRVSDLWGYAATVMVCGGLATLYCCMQTRDAASRAGKEAKKWGLPDAASGAGDDAL